MVLAQRANNAVDTAWQHAHGVLQDHVESIGRLAQQGVESLRTIDHIVQSLIRSTEDDSEVQRLFGDETVPAMQPPLPATTPVPMAERRRTPRSVSRGTWHWVMLVLQFPLEATTAQDTLLVQRDAASCPTAVWTPSALPTWADVALLALPWHWSYASSHPLPCVQRMVRLICTSRVGSGIR